MTIEYKIAANSISSSRSSCLTNIYHNFTIINSQNKLSFQPDRISVSYIPNKKIGVRKNNENWLRLQKVMAQYWLCTTKNIIFDGSSNTSIRIELTLNLI